MAVASKKLNPILLSITTRKNRGKKQRIKKERKTNDGK